MVSWQSAVVLLGIWEVFEEGIAIQHEKTDRDCKSARKTPELGKWESLGGMT
jgi:hypothetical protein